jgi:hypothetical protein
MSSQNFVGDVLGAIAEALTPLSEALKSTEELAVLLGELGWTLDPAAPASPVKQSFGPVPVGLDNVAKAAKRLAELPPNADAVAVASAIGDLGGAVATVAQDLRTLGPPSGTPPPPLGDSAFWSSLPGDLLDLLLVRYLERRQPRLFGLLRLAGIASEDVQAAVGNRGAFSRRQIHWDRIVTLASNPPKLMTDAYGWGLVFDHTRFVIALADVLRSFDSPVDLSQAVPALLDEYWTPTAPARKEIMQLRAPLHREIVDNGTDVDLLSVSLIVMPIPPLAAAGTSTSAPTGLTLVPAVTGQAAREIEVTESVRLALSGGFESAAALRLEIRPVSTAVATTLTGRLDAEAQLIAEPTQPWVLLGTRDSTRLELAKAHLALAAHGTPPDLEVGIEAAADTAALVIDFGEGDGFLQKLLGGKPLRFEFAAGLAWSDRSGFRFLGQATLEVTLAVHLSVLGVIEVQSVFVALGADPGAGRATLTLAVSGKLQIGPVRATLDRVGMRAELADRSKGGARGNLGDADVGFAFRPPNGAGLSLDTPAVKGGGALLFDEPKGLYAGLLRLEIKGGIGVTAIGLITTKLPDGSRGFSLLVVIAAEFPSFQLGFGFTLNGIGGLLGANREMRVDALRAGVRNRVLDSFLFPPNPVKNASKVIADLQAVFPVSPGRFVIGLMARIGWGTPTIISVDLGLIIELPAPIRIAILGRLSLQLPQGKAVVQLKMDVLGILDFDRREASIDATLYDSRVAAFTVSGDMAVRLSFGASPAFAMSAGGFNQRYTPPPDFPELARMSIALATGDNPRLTLQAYFAKTPATVQFGARLDVYAALDLGFIGLFEASGYLSFDALVQPFPPMFIIDIAGGLVLRRNGRILFGIEVWLTLSGPTPWRACGEATIHFLGKHTIPFDVTVGSEAVLPALPPVDPLGDLLNALGTARNWTGLLPAGGSGPVTVRPLDPGVASVVHPFGNLTVRQEAVPLGLDVSRYQTVDLVDSARFEIDSIAFGPSSAPQTVAPGDPTRTYFATGEYVTRSGEENLSLPAFESFRCGHTAIGFAPGSVLVKHGPAVTRPDEDYDTAIIDQAEPQPKPNAADTYQARPEVLDALVSASAAGRSPLRITGTEGYTGPPSGLKLREPRYRIARRTDMKAASDSVYDTAAEAQDALRDNDDRALQMVGAHELAQ